ncbi:hypothetical protein ACWD4V_18280 [Streptomyces tsukubensis]
MTHSHPSPPSRFRLEFTAFCETNREAYLRYAQLRLQDPAQARHCVDTVLAALGRRWPAVLASDCPAARVWSDLRAEARHRTVTAALRAGRLHTALRDDQADIMLLHHHLRLPLDDAAGLMGLPRHDARALLRGAERALNNLLER